MTYEVMYSLRMALEYALPELNDVQIIYDGADLSDIPKPFATIEYLMSSGEVLSAGRRSYENTYDMQVGVFARDVNELYLLESKIRSVLREPYGHPLFAFVDEAGDFYPSGNSIVFDENGFTPMLSDDNSDETRRNRGYFDVSVEHLTYINK